MNHEATIATLNAQLDNCAKDLYEKDKRIAELERQLAEASAPAVGQQPVAYLRFRAAQQWSGIGGHDIEYNEWLETCHAHEIGDDKMPAFPVYATPQAADTDKVREAILRLQFEDADTDYRDGYNRGIRAAANTVGSITAQAPVREVPGWISVDERLPEYGAEVLVFQPEKERKVTALARFTSNVWDYYWDAAHIGKGRMTRPASVTHWMPLPAAPVQQEPKP